MTEFKIYAPLSDFVWRGSRFTIAPGIELVPRPSQPYPLRGLDDFLSEFDQHQLFWANHWLVIDSSEEDEDPSELLNLFLIALWLVLPTRAQAKFRFHVAMDREEAPGSMHRLLERFQWIEGAVADEMEDEDLRVAASFLPALRDVRLADSRLSNALHLTLAGCRSFQWQVAVVCFAAAAEAILTCGERGRITHRLSRNYALLLGSEESERDRFYTEFKDLYGKRSDVMHGKGYAMPLADKLPAVARFGDALRHLWKAVIRQPTWIEELDRSDEHRKKLFERLRGSYAPPGHRP